ncbi:MAG: glycosyltransferase family 4 protein [Methanobacterium sp.]
MVIITTSTFPEGNASTNRILAYCKGLIENYETVYVISIKPNYNCEKRAIRFNYYGVNIDYFALPNLLPISNKFLRFMNRQIIYAQTIHHFFIKKYRSTSILFHGRSLIIEIIVYIICRLNDNVLLFEEDEHPSIYSRNMGFVKRNIYGYCDFHIRYKLYSGYLIMTESLIQYFLNLGIPEDNMKLIPHTVVIERFVNPISIYKFNKYMCFVGSLNENKDGILSLVKAFSIISNKYNDLHLVIAGYGSKLDKQLLFDLIHIHNLSPKVHFLGELSSNVIPGLLNNALVLLSCRPYSVQALYGFSTKIVEYLATGKPIVTTAYGDLKNYLKDGVNAFVAESSNYQIFANKIIEVIENYDKAIEVGQKGKELAVNSFNPTTQAKMIIDFVSELRMRKRY